MDGDYVLVVGSAVLEISAMPGGRLQPGTRQYGHIHALSGAVIFGILKDVPIDEAMRSASPLPRSRWRAKTGCCNRSARDCATTNCPHSCS